MGDCIVAVQNSTEHLAQAITLLNALGRRLVRIPAGTQAVLTVLTEVSCISPQSLQANAGTGPELLAAP